MATDTSNITKEQQYINKLQLFNSGQLWEFTDTVFPKDQRGGKSYKDIWENPESCKLIYDHIQSTLPPIRKVKSVNDILVGDTLVYTMQPAGTGMYLPKVGERWEMKTEYDIIEASIQIIERGRGWWPIEQAQ